ncbi:flavin monoamine oxidase family protein [Tsukamurella tyrosinosolvens]|uniref:flavin monoamine oxidase family protein n=1 Tax=Tsukamurella tyrosinosolvens TaxID=57704 RepID=UPI0036ACC237
MPTEQRPTQKHNRDTDVVIVGAGLAGLSAADELRHAGTDYLVVEARDRVGGRTLNYDLGNGKVVELGGQWVGPGQDRILDTAAQLGIKTYPTYDDGDKVAFTRGRTVRYHGLTPPAAPWSLLDLGQALYRLNRMSRSVPAQSPWTAPKANNWDAQTLGEWTRRNTRTRYARSNIELWSHAVLAADPGEISLLHALAHASAHRGVFAVASTTDGAQEERIEGGSQRISQALADRLGPERLLLGQPVRTIRYADDAAVITTDDYEITAQRVIVAVSPAIAGTINYYPPLPAARDQLFNKMAMGTIAKVIAVYPTPFWRAHGLSGQAIGDQGPVTFAFDNTPPDGSPGVLVGFVAGRHARKFAELDPAERRSQSLDSFARWFGTEAHSATDYADQLWNNEQWSRGGYFGYFTPGGWTGVGKDLAAPVGPIHWAGAETSGICMGSMDAALRSGTRAANEVLQHLHAGTIA